MKVLIADDEEVIRISLEGILKTIGISEMDFAVDGEEAISKAQAGAYDLILMDLNMPKKDGYEALTQIRSFNAKVPVIFITATGDPKKIMQSIAQNNLTAFIEKPFSPTKVIEVIQKAVRR